MFYMVINIMDKLETKKYTISEYIAQRIQRDIKQTEYCNDEYQRKIDQMRDEYICIGISLPRPYSFGYLGLNLSISLSLV